MKTKIRVLLAGLVIAVGLLFGLWHPESSAVKVCRADAQRFAEENASYAAEYDSLYGATTLGQHSISDLLDRERKIIDLSVPIRATLRNIRPLSIGTAS